MYLYYIPGNNINCIHNILRHIICYVCQLKKQKLSDNNLWIKKINIYLEILIKNYKTMKKMYFIKVNLNGYIYTIY